MKRSSQDKPSKTSSVKPTTGSSKIKDMQKAYGISSKSSSSKPSKTGRIVEAGKVGSDSSLTTSKKSKSSIGGQTSSSSGVFSGSSSTATGKSKKEHSTANNSSKSSSKILAVSRANYAEKYGSPSQKATKELNNIGNHAQTKPAYGNINNNNNSPYGNSSKKAVSVKSNLSSISRLSNQKPPKNMYESETAEEYDEEEFEEDYESDFEEGNSTDVEEGVEPEAEYSRNGASSVVDDFDKSSSIREFEQLEKMVEVEEEQRKSLAQVKDVMSLSENINKGAGEPAASKISLGQRSQTEDEEEDESDEESEEEDDKSDIPESRLTKKQNAFPTMTGFSISSSVHTEQQPMYQEWTKSAQRQRKGYGGSSTTKTNSIGPRKESESQKKTRTNRGKVIQGMIKLDRVAIDIFHLQPYPYERFMSVFSGTDRLQTSTQTDQDKSIESVQTDPIDQVTKWTQKPPTWSTTSSSCDIRIVRQEALGVGSDEFSDDSSPDQKIYKQFDFLKNWEQLSKFILRASRKMLYVLEAEERIKLPSSSGKKGSLETIKMNRGLSVLSKLEMHTLAGDGEFVGCANGAPFQAPTKDNTTNGNKKHTSKNLITVWSLKEPSIPLYFLRVWGHVSALKVHMIGRMIISGNRDGSMNVWNLDEPLCYHSQYQEHVIRTPSVNTSCMLPTHSSTVLGIEMFSESKNTFSIISIDKEGLLITWSCLRSNHVIGESSNAQSQYSSAWSTIHMSVRHQIQLGEISKDHLQITCFSAFWDSEEATTGFYFGTFNGYVAKGKMIVESGDEKSTNVSATIEKYQERTDSNPKIICMDISKQLNILAMGCDDGRCRLFELSRKKLVLSLGGKQEQEPIKVKWSGRRCSVLYVAFQDCLLIWDLLSSDMNPWKTVHLKDIRDFVLYSPPHKEYLVVITGKDLIISTPADEIKPLNSRDFTRIQSYFSLLC